jgi:hypothetical protein
LALFNIFLRYLSLSHEENSFCKIKYVLKFSKAHISRPQRERERHDHLLDIYQVFTAPKDSTEERIKDVSLDHRHRLLYQMTKLSLHLSDTTASFYELGQSLWVSWFFFFPFTFSTALLRYNSHKVHRTYYLALVAHACDPSYSGGRDQEDCGLKPAWANRS